MYIRLIVPGRNRFSKGIRNSCMWTGSTGDAGSSFRRSGFSEDCFGPVTMLTVRPESPRYRRLVGKPPTRS